LFCDRYRKLSDLPERLPVFPLRGVILLPRTQLPLNVFEPRYLAMVDDVLGGDRLIGLVQPQNRLAPQGGSIDEEDLEAESPRDRAWPLRDTGCIGRITSFSEQEDGRVFVSLTGIARFTVLAEDDVSKPYRICRIGTHAFADDLASDRGEAEVDRDRLLTLLRAYLEAHELEVDWRSIQQSSTELLVNTLAIHSPFGAEEKQALLEAADLRTRSEILMALAEMDLATGSGGNPGGPLQ
jgi:hypothetical protein